MKPIDLTGKRFGRLVANSVATGTKLRSWDCVCDCGNKSVVLAGALTSGNTKSCGCFHKDNLINKNKSHGLCNSPEYKVWAAMHQRCSNKNYKEWHRYGGRGISVCERWSSFENFYNDMGIRTEGYSIERMDNNGNYSPENCKWAQKLDQANNTSTNAFVTAFGETKTLSNWVRDERCILQSSQTLGRRLARGMSAELALTTPSKQDHSSPRDNCILHAKALFSFSEVG